MAPKERILLQVLQIRYKKGIGTLYLKNRRFLWKAENKVTDNVSFSHLYSELKSLKMAVKGKKNVILKIILHNDVFYNIHFMNRAGLHDRAAHLDQVKNLLLKFIRKFKRKTDLGFIDNSSRIQKNKKDFQTKIHTQILIRRLNQQSIMVCKNQMEALGSENRNGPEDLEKNYNNLKTTSPLNLLKVERYFHGPIPKIEQENINAEHVRSATEDILEQAKQWQNLSKLPSSSLMSPEAALEAIIELTPKDTLGKSSQEQLSQQVVPDYVKSVVKNLYLSLSELLTQFWKSFPLCTPQQREKAYKMHAELRRFHETKLKLFEDRLQKVSFPLGKNPTRHLNQLLDAAYRKLKKWRQFKHHHFKQITT